jgi:hypothetical protein
MQTQPCDNGAYLCNDDGTCDRERSVCAAYGVPECILPDAECEVACVFGMPPARSPLCCRQPVLGARM